MAQLKLGLIGLGALGSRIATRLLRTGFSLEIYDIADVAVRMFNMDVGGIITGSPKMMAQACEIIITVLPSAAEVREVAFGWEGLARGFTKGGVLIDMGSSDPMATSRLAEELAGCGIDMVDAPALGTAEEAKTGKLTFVVGGREAAVERCRPIFEALGERILRAGTAGSGQAAAALADFLRGVEMLAATEALRVGQRCGVEAAMLLDIGEGLSAVGPLVGGILRRQVLTRQFDSGLALGHLLKSLETASNAAQACGVQAPLLAACRDTWAAAETRLGSGADQSALIRWLETLMPARGEV
jgi:3-hydroxyisobutyrate dehydrogenase-like beta-hydroxyacid dehydrogenase